MCREKLEKLEKEKRTGSRRGSPATRASGLAASSAPRLSGARTCPFVEKGPARLRRRSDDDPLLQINQNPPFRAVHRFDAPDWLSVTFEKIAFQLRYNHHT